MTQTQIKNKITELDFWLTNNPHHTDYGKVLQDKKELEFKLLTKDYEKSKTI